MAKVILRLAADAVLVAILLFLAAGTLAWQQAWILLGLMCVVRVAGAIAVYRVSPALLRERARFPVHSQQRGIDRALLLGVLGTGFLGLPLIAGFDVFRWHVFPTPAPVVAGFGLTLFALGWSLKSLALRANAFAVTVVRMQRERAHHVVDSGPYAIVRHPFYAADPLILAGLSLWLGSYLAAACAAIPIACMVMRLNFEERLLRRELPGYARYADQVRFRLIPRVW